MRLQQRARKLGRTRAEARMHRIVSPGRAAWVFASAVLSAGAVHASVVFPLPHRPELQAIADRVHGFTVQVRARAFLVDQPDGHLRGRELLSSASGVLVGNGLVLTGLGTVAMRGPQDGLQPASEIVVVVDDVGTLPARLLAVDANLGIAVLQLPEEASSLAGASLATEDPNVGDAMLAIGVDGDSIRVVGLVLEQVGVGDDARPRLQTDHALPPLFWGGPLFDDRGKMAGITIHPPGTTGTAVPASVLRPLLQRLLGTGGI
jgi:S1-C subfamily serine protease